ncbi:hypothetical protein HBI56_210210 [Parastagonospora nodorum]|uniref:Nephrocystin 3-like N-terminal domain-containing protein n=1 Tax=Phaeosphaeria nodorum (strain SN15 / ATCC MYA-4574 / FGSC 10173) TaxID=321614 RepID=A0A7U2F353_PHANO|nr:hypothetical protein HBH56_214110 [Parastagonospora nodorum]QRC97810.1 hypothetical protein JI435_151560 [Parastagonospora nodorum SN15]KAH3923069.1 hypothetical protein HBH54_215780 [Parastagonospora nodorum]KAH3941790.1 hypothetical protein HBH53_196330 [Parastagonospora nodorum]KAH3966712.1 hypothetical protein HBH52_195820 [Parastagonospora nodorum]
MRHRPDISDPRALFASIYKGFNDALPQDIQKDFVGIKDPALALERFNRLVKDSESSSVKTRRAMKVTAKLADKTGPYFEVVNIYIQSHPEYAALVAKIYTTFLSKIEVMLPLMTTTMPDFQLFMIKLRENKLMSTTEFRPRLTQALAWIYNDILEFCRRICTLLHPQQKGFNPKWKLFSNMAFKPFDAHFAETIENVEIHSTLFRDLANTTSAIMALEFYSKWEAHMSKVHARLDQVQNQQRSQGKRNDNDKTLMNTAISELQRRVGSPVWASAFEHARIHRVEESCEWLLAHPLMAEHIENNSTTSARQVNVLFLYGKPGYGKTTLATAVIDHSREMALLRRKNRPDSLAFFFFDRQSRFDSSYDAFRALLAQLIFCRRFDQIVLDIAAIARPDYDTGQHLASNDEIFRILHLFLVQFSTCDLVCDGVDECKDRDNFLAKVSQLATDHE